jgi:hypothetical protein
MVVPAPAPSANTAASVDTTGSATEIAVLQARLAEYERAENRLLDTVLWTLGVALTIVVALVGFSWFANFRLLEREKTSLRAELRAVMESEIGDKARALSDKQTEAMAQFTKQANELQGKMQKMAEAGAATALENADARISQIADELLEIRYEIIDFTLLKWKNITPVPSNAFNTAVEWIAFAKEHDHWSLSDALDAAKKALDAGAMPEANNLANLHTATSGLGDEHKDVVAALRAQATKQQK